MKSLALVLLIVGLGAACSSAPKFPDGEEKKSKLTFKEARTRKAQINKVDYELVFDLEIDEPSTEKEKKPRKIYGGKTLIKFFLSKNASEKSDELFVDFTGGKILGVKVNGQELENPNYNGERLTFKTSQFHPSKENWLEVRFQRVYSRYANGLYRFEDPKDKRIYLYTDLEPFFANKVFPCFDQPDLKSSFKTTVNAPKGWTVISNTYSRKIKKNGKYRRLWEFKRTKRFSTYLWALHAGPYKSWKSQYKKTPMRLYARQSLAKHVDYKNWFKITKAGFRYFEKNFGRRYPFTKYDQILVPDFNWGGMENVGAVTYNDSRYVFRSKPDREKLHWRASVMMHELAHMWFGNLVTMDWWNGLWLNESFATFAASLALDDLKDKLNVMDAWSNFNAWSKRGAYYADQLKTTHPIDVPVKDTVDAISSFDAISYGKGGAVLKQLYSFVGKENFMRGLRRYFRKHAFKNTSIDDLIRAISKSSHRNLDEWKKLWLESAGVNTLKVDWKCKAKRISHFDLLQSGTHPATGQAQPLRPHRTEIAFYRISGWGKNKRLKLQKVFPATYSDKVTSLTNPFGTRCPALVFPNYGDWDYVKLDLDAKSIKNIEKYLYTIKDELTRLMIWETLYQMVTDGKYSAQRYMDLVLRELSIEQSQQVNSRIMASAFSDSAADDQSLRYLTPNLRISYRSKLENVLYRRFTKSKKGSSAQQFWFKNYLAVAASKEAGDRLTAWLKLKKLRGISLNQERRWQIIYELSRMGDTRSQKQIETELKKDKSDYGKKWAIGARAAFPSQDNKNYWTSQVYRTASADELLPIADTKTALCCIGLSGQEHLLEEMDDKFFSELPSLAERSDPIYARKVARSMRPANCDEDNADRGESLASRYEDEAKVLFNAYSDVGQSNRRCLRARALLTPKEGSLP